MSLFNQIFKKSQKYIENFEKQNGRVESGAHLYYIESLDFILYIAHMIET